MGSIELTPELKQFHEEVEKDHFHPLWEAIPKVILQEPRTDAVPYMWKWDLIKKRIMRAGELITPEKGGERRVLIFENPSLREKNIYGATTNTLTAAIQLIFPGEIAPSHRHSQTAIRFVLSGDGAYTAVQGEKIFLKEGDFLLTPQWAWHDHGHVGEGPMIWLDGLDIPFVKMMNGTFFEHHPNNIQEVNEFDNLSSRRYADGMVRPIADRKRRGYPSPLTTYRWDKTYNALKSLNELGEADPFDAVAVEFFNPANGESSDYNITSWMQMLRPGEHTKAHRHVYSSIYMVHKGKGHTIINGEKFEWSKGDLLVIPTWYWHEHVNDSDTEEALLFSFNDLPLYEKNNLNAEQEYMENGGHQKVKKTFIPHSVELGTEK